MLFRFNHKRQRKADRHNKAQKEAVSPISQKWILLKERCASWMQAKTEKLSKKGKIILLILLVLGMSSYSIYLLAGSFSRKNAFSFAFKKIDQAIRVQPLIDKKARASASTSTQEFLKIKAFSRYMDSLSQSGSGRKLYDSITAGRPGLMDSVAFIKNLYQLQAKKK